MVYTSLYALLLHRKPIPDEVVIIIQYIYVYIYIYICYIYILR